MIIRKLLYIMKSNLSDEIRKQVRKDRDRIVLTSSRDSSFIHLGLVTFFILTVWDEPNLLPITFLVVIIMYLTILLRFSISMYAKNLKEVSKLIIYIHNVTLIAYAFGWGYLTYEYLVSYGLTAFLTMIIIMISTSVGAGAASSISISPKTFIASGLGVYGPAIYYGALHLDEKYYFFLFVAYSLFFASQIKQSFWSAKLREQLITSEEDVKIERARAEQSARLAAIGEMAGGVAHEINSPLAAMLGYVAMMEIKIKKDIPDADKLLDITTKIKNVIEKISKIITSLRTFASEKDLTEFEKISVTKLIEETTIFCMNRFQNQKVDLRSIVDNDFQIECQVKQMIQVLLNLLNNSFYAIQNSSNAWIEIKALKHTDFAEITVTDSGAGIAKEIQEKIMQPFFTTKDIGEGTGLGLSTSQGIVHNHQGRLFYDSVSKNTKFVIQIPYDQSQTQVIDLSTHRKANQSIA